VQFEFLRKPRLPTAPDSIAVGKINVPLMFVANHRARRYTLRVRADGTARVTIPRRGTLRSAREFVERNIPWIELQLERIAARPKEDRTWRIGSQLMFRGDTVTIHQDGDAITFADQAIEVRVDEGQVDLRPSIEHRLRTLAARELPSRVFQLAQHHDLTVQRVTVRNQKSRWGSCSRRGTISLNWRLVQSPPFVSDYIILHELMHLRQMNHSPKFWHEVETVCPGFRVAERWLKTHRELLR